MRLFGLGRLKKSREAQVLEVEEVLKAIEDFEFAAARGEPLQALKCFEERIRGRDILHLIGPGEIYDSFMVAKRNVEAQINGRTV